MKLLAPALAPALFASLAACSSSGSSVGGEPVIGAVSRIKCASLDWFEVGLYDGGQGYEQPTRFDYLNNQCSGHGQRVERDRYEAGYAEGRARAG